MTLLWVTIACLIGVWAGGQLLHTPYALEYGIACGLPAGLWLIPAAGLPLAPWLNRWAIPVRNVVTVWPESAGFRRPVRAPSPALIAACLLAAAVGLLRALGAPAERCWTSADLASYNVPADSAFDRSLPALTLFGTITSYVPDSTARIRVTVTVDQLEQDAGHLQISGRLTLLVDGAQAGADTLRYGSRVRVWGTPSTPPVFSGFSYRDYLARHGIHSQMALGVLEPAAGKPGGNPLLRLLYPVRKAGERLLNQALPEPYAALANGMLLGIDANIPDDTMSAFNDASASHVLVISGSNVALLSGMLLALGLRWWKERTAGLVTLAMLALYTLLVGGEPSVVRAAGMGAMVVLAIMLKRRTIALVSLAAAALVMVLINPNMLHDVGFQLSAAATAGLVLLVPLLPGGRVLDSARVAGEGLVSPLTPLWDGVRDALVVTLAATVAVQPLLLYHFQRLSLVGLLTNVLIVPVQPLLLTLGSGGLLVGILAKTVGAGLMALPLLWAAALPLAWTLAVVEWTSHWRWASLAIGGYSAAAMALTYAVLGLLVWQAQRRRNDPAPAAGVSRLTRLLASPATTGALALACALVGMGLWSLPTGRLTVRAVEADRGDALVITTPSGGQLLVDGGGDTAALLTVLGSTLPLWDRKIELSLLTVDDTRSAEGQSGLTARLQVANAMSTAGPGEARDLWARVFAEAGVDPLPLPPEASVDLGDGLVLWVLPGEEGEPAAAKLVYGEFALLLPGSAGAPAVEVVAANPDLWAADVLLAPDIREGDEAAADWMSVARPELVLSWEDATLVPPAGLAPRFHVPAAHGPLTLFSDGTTWETEPSP